MLRTCTLILFTGSVFISVALAADSGGSCGAPKTAAQTSVVDMPNYGAADAVPDAATQARQRAWSDYQRDLVATLSASSDPRDMIVATLVSGQSAAKLADDITLLRRAANSAPNDVMVQRLVLASARHLDTNNPDVADLLTTTTDTLTRIEPDNAETWIEVLQRAAQHRDRAGVTAALARMSTATHADGHFAEITKLVADSFARIPSPPELTDAVAENAGFSTETMPYISAMAVSAAFALPAYQYLTTACQWDESGRNADRAADCEQIGRHMSRRGDTMLGQAIGFAVLRVSHTYNDDDLQAAHDMDWVTENFQTKALAEAHDTSGSELNFVAYQKIWLDTDSELEAMRNSIVQAGLPPTPPDGWVARSPRFSAERLQHDDENGAARIAKAGY